MPKIPKELETAILTLPIKERDKMLLKLIGKNELLINQLYFQLLEDESDLKDKRDTIKNSIDRVAKLTHDSPGWMMMDMRDLNAKITNHYKVTKDKYGEIELTLHLLNTFFDKQIHLMATYNRQSDTLASYVAKRTEAILKKLPKLNEDYYIEFEDEVNKLLENVHTYCPAPYARQMGIPKVWKY
ncbi:MAG: hypothetical protein MUF45_13470 [Spirosomaceae bacterium]|nr:hypothetical protein [Spirosomataceae bacterium]